jgi:hypothetical protein
MKPIVKRIFIGVAGLACFAVIAFVALIGYVMLGMPTLTSLSRTGEKLPAIFVEDGNTVYCRMRYCDFRFPLPNGGQIVWTNIESGGFDTIKGTVYVIETNRTPINLRVYAELLEKKHFDLSITDLTGCDCCTNIHVAPFVSNGKLIKIPDFSSIGASSRDPLGGWITADLVDTNAVKIRFSYFGDD